MHASTRTNEVDTHLAKDAFKTIKNILDCTYGDSGYNDNFYVTSQLVGQ